MTNNISKNNQKNIKSIYSPIEQKYYNQKLEFLEKITSLLATDNKYWNYKLISQAEEECKFTHGYHYILFPNGIYEIIESFEQWINNQLLKKLKTNINQPQKIREKISLALHTRIINIIPKKTLFNHISFLLIPNNIWLSQKYAFKTVDLIWQYAGDQSIDFNYYTKRSLLLPIYLASIMFYISDESNENQKTDEFITSTLNKVVNIISYKNKIKLPKIENIPILRYFF